MSLPSTIAELQDEARSAYNLLVIKLADGQDVPKSEIRAVLWNACKDLDQLKADIELHKGRRFSVKHAAELQRLDETISENDDIERKARETLARLKAEYEIACVDPLKRLQAAQRARAQAEEQRSRLLARKTAILPEDAILDERRWVYPFAELTSDLATNDWLAVQHGEWAETRIVELRDALKLGRRVDVAAVEQEMTLCQSKIEAGKAAAERIARRGVPAEAIRAKAS